MKTLIVWTSILLALSCRPACLAAEPAWRDGLKLLDSSSPADIAAAEHLLLQATKAGAVPAEAFCTLALVQLRREKPAEALAALAQRTTRYGSDELKSTAALALRIKLYAALEIGDRDQADNAFKDLVRQIVAQSGDAIDLRFSAVSIGVVVAMLEAELAESPISKRDLKIASECMLQSTVPGVAVAFTSAHQQASEQTAELARQFLLINERGIEAIAAENAARLQSLDVTLAQLAEQKELAAEIFRNAREQTEQNTRDRRKVDRLIASIQAELRKPTPGHPGPQRRAPPPPPPPSSIFVNEYEIRTQIEYQNQNGQLVGIPVTREYRRNQSDIDYERDAKYQRVQQDYQRVQADYDRYLATYNQALKNWNEADGKRRQELGNQMAGAEAQRAELSAESERLKSEKSAAAEAVVRKRTAREQEEFELELQAIALAAARAQKPAMAFRPRHFPVLSWSQEKALLQRNAQ